MTKIDPKLIRNFSIIAHIDHGKSTLADRLLEYTHAISPRQMKEQFLDQMDLERERGITIKLKAIRINYQADDGQTYIFNLIDTPGHVDFNYEVSRSLAACEGALLVIDASQGIEAQTLANFHLAQQNKLAIIPVINKVDLPSADPARIKEELATSLKLDPGQAILASAKENIGTKEILEAIVRHIPPPQGKADIPLKALVFDSHYDPYRGVVAYIKIQEGHINTGESIKLMRSGKTYEVQEVGFFTPDLHPTKQLVAGEVGYMIAGVKDIRDLHIGETITSTKDPAAHPLPGYRPAKPMVFCGFYPAQGENFYLLRQALEKLQLNDAALSFEPETSAALGTGFRCGFLGILHMEIIWERLKREFAQELIATSPSVVYQIKTQDGRSETLANPVKLPSPDLLASISEPFVSASIITPDVYLGPIIKLAQERRGQQAGLEYLSPTRVCLTYILPLAEIIVDFFDQLKSISQGYASLDYEILGYEPSELVKLEILLNGDVIDAFTTIVPKENAYYKAKQMVEKLKEVIPRHMFAVPIQASTEGRIIARETVPALKKHVTGKCYGGDISRKKKLWAKQKEGKKRLAKFGEVEVPSEAFLAILKK